MNTILNGLSVLSTVVVIEGIVYLFLNAIFGRIEKLNTRIIDGIKLKHILFFSIGLLLITFCIEMYLPW